MTAIRGSRNTPHPTLPRKGGGFSVYTIRTKYLYPPPLRGRVGWGVDHPRIPTNQARHLSVESTIASARVPSV
jgi:hypothetical protein